MSYEVVTEEEAFRSAPKVRAGCLMYRAPAPVRVTVNGHGSLLGKRDTLTITFDEERPERMTMSFDWNVEEVPLQARYEANQKAGGEVNVWFEHKKAAEREAVD